jgi:hypothetical protein
VKTCSVFPPYLRTETDPVFETLCFLFSRTPDDGQSPKTPEILSVIHHHQNPLESAFMPVFEPAQPFNWLCNVVYSDIFRFLMSLCFLVVLKAFTVTKDISNRSCGANFVSQHDNDLSSVPI